MSNTQVLPVTAQQATEAKISNSVKISKQLMKAELKKRMVNLKEEYIQAGSVSDANRKVFNSKLKDEVERQVHMELQNDGQITRFRNLYARFSRFNSDDKNFPKFESNLDMLKDFELDDITCMLFRNEVFDDDKDYQEFLLGRASVTVKLNIPDRPHSDDRGPYAQRDIEKLLGYEQPVHISQDIRDLYAECKELDAAAFKLNVQYNEVETKLKGIDEVAEEMEAQLLVNELSQSEEGKAALKIAGTLVGDMLGDKPALLNISDE